MLAGDDCTTSQKNPSYALEKVIMAVNNLTNLGSSRMDYIAKSVVSPVKKVLDIGCSYGWALESLQDKAEELYGIDMDQNALDQAARRFPKATYTYQTAAELPFGDASFDLVILSEVIEHVGDENKQLVIDEAWRVLKDNGVFIFTAPYAGLFAWADHLDFKRRCSWIYRIYMKLSGYVPDTPVEVGHEHLSLQEIDHLFDGRFHIEEITFCGLFMPFINWVLVVGSRLSILPKPFQGSLNKLQAWESGVRYPRWLAFNVRLKAIKREI
jgi:SAM-dependent methyltransferase